jgi:trimeric autotransporter adhesin
MRRLLLVALLATEACLSGASAPSAVASLQVASNVSSAGVFVGDSVQINATPLDLDGNVVPVPITYASSNITVATIDNFGKIKALAAGQSTISVKAGGQVDNLTLTVDGNVTGSVQVVPASPTIDVNTGSVQLTATVITTVGNPGRNKSVTWSTSDASKAAVSSTGLVTPVAVTAGVSICATATDATNVKGCTTVTVSGTAAFLITPVSPRRR